MRRLPLLTILAVPNLAFAEALCTDSVALRQSDQEMLEALEELDLSTTTELDCSPLVVSVQSVETGVAVSVTLPWGETESRTLPSHRAAAIWVDSWLAGERLGELMAPASGSSVLLYSTFEDWQAGRSSGQTEAAVIQSASNTMWRVQDGLQEFYTLDLSISQAKEHGQVYAFQLGSQVYLNTSSPRPNRLASYSPVILVGEYGVLQDEVCVWVPQTQVRPGHMTCDGFVRLVDLRTGETESVSKLKLKRWLEQDPELREAWSSEGRRNDGTVHRYLVELLSRQPDVVLD